MKTIFLFSILFCAIAMPALAELTDADLDKIRLIVNDEIDASEKRFDTKIQALETRMKEHITQQIDSLKTPVAWLIGILVALIALISIPLVALTILIGWRSVKDNSQEKNQSRTPRRNRNAEATADCPTLTNTAFEKVRTHAAVKENDGLCR